MAIVRDLLKIKGNQVWSVSSDTSVKDALKVLANKDIGAVLVIDNDKIVGIFSERDFARHMVSVDILSDTLLVKTLMSQPVYFINPDQCVEDCMALMTAKHFRHLPVMENGKLIGLVSIGDVVKQMISEKEITIKGLEDYILGHDYSH
jgi:CBS domain-containing protein